MISSDIIAIFSQEGFTLRVASHHNKDGFYDESLLVQFEKSPTEALYTLGFADLPEQASPSFAYLHHFAHTFINALLHDPNIEITRLAPPLTDDTANALLHSLPFALGTEYIQTAWLSEQWAKLATYFAADLALATASSDASDTITVEAYLQAKNPSYQTVGRVYFHLVEHHEPEHPFAFIATYSTGTQNRLAHLPLKNALTEYREDMPTLLHLLKTVGQVADQSDLIRGLEASGELFSPLRFTTREAHIFLTEVPLYEQNGVLCRIPNWWRKKSGFKVSASVGSSIADTKLGVDTLLDFDAQLYYNDMLLTKEEIEQLLSEANGLTMLKGHWVEVDHDKLRAALDAFEQVDALNELTFAEAMRFQLGLDTLAGGIDNGAAIEVQNAAWLQTFLTELQNASLTQPVAQSADFHAALRHYQQKGVDWLFQMRQYGFGALLADDMGLGKTIQILALLDYLRAQGLQTKTLLILPASLLCNWQKEAAKFAPKLRLTVLHAKNRTLDLECADVFLTTYGMTTRLEALSETKWDLLILDEAQALKNPKTKQSKTIRDLNAKMKIAMTGTPIENRLSDLWAIFDFLNRGLLGTMSEFQAFTKQLSNDGAGYGRLRAIIAPFLLRRLKTDKTIIADLPDKIEVKARTELTKKQLVLYKKVLSELEKSLQEQDENGIERKGLILASVMKFKQLCNHPDHYLGQTTFDPKQSGKFEKLAEICETIAQKQERVLVFTQFKEMTEPLDRFLQEIFGAKGLVLHGGTSVKKRGEMVEQFNSSSYIPYMVLSLKAGGVGLNLTAANHVVHFDRWWNPAIENQATDRAFRIGQQKNVIVHKFVTVGTLEEKIDSMLEEKQAMANELIQKTGETHLTELPNEQILDLFRLEV